MSNFPTGAGLTLKSNTIPGAFLELVQILASTEAIDRPDQTNLTLTFSQTLAQVSVAFPAESRIPMTGIVSIEPRHLYGGVEKTVIEIPENFNIDFPDAAGEPTSTPLDSALIQMAFALKDAERLTPPTGGTGITTLNYNDQTQIFNLSASIPIDLTIGTGGAIEIVATDYTPTAVWVTLLGG